jgi:membrane protease YdiL (CAAX protease family)
MVVLGNRGMLIPGRWRWLRSLAWMVVLGAALILTFNAVARGVLILMLWTSGNRVADFGNAPAADRLLSAIAGCAALILAYWGAVHLAERRAAAELSLRRMPLDLLLGGAVGAGLMAAIIAILWTAGWVSIETRPITAIALAARDSLRSGVVEELLLRLVIFRLVWRAFGLWPAFAFAAILFGLLHLANPDSGWFAVVALIAGEGIGIALYLITGRIWAPIGMHAAWNFAQGWLFGAMVSGTSEIAGGPLATRPVHGVAELLSGGGFGPEASLTALAVSLLASAGLLWLASTRGDFATVD